MSDEESTLALNSTAADVNSDPSSNMTPENTSETPPGVKTAPPVAPKPAWFRQSLRKIGVEQDQKKQAIPAEQRHTGGSKRSFKVRDASYTANLSIKQKIHSFETFSSPEGPEKGGNRRPLVPSTSLPPTEKESRSHPASHGDGRKGKREIPEEIQAQQSASVRGTDNINISAVTSSTSETYHQTTAKSPEDEPPSAPSSTSETYRQTTAKSSEDEPPSAPSSTHLPLSDTVSTDLDSEIHDSHSAPVHDDFSFKSEPEGLISTRSTEDKVLPPETSSTSNHADGEGPPEGTEEGGEQGPGKLPSMTLPTDSNPLRGLEGESLGKILAFSNQVTQALMRSPPMNPCSGNPRSPTQQDFSAEDLADPQESEHTLNSTDRGFSVSLATLRECTIERGEEGAHHQAAGTSACAHSVISAIPSQEIERMVQEVKALDEETLKQLVDIHVVILHKEEGAGLGFSIAGGSDLESKAPTIHRVFPSGLAAQEGTIQKGDEVLSINGHTLRGLTHADATATVRLARDLTLAVVVVCKRAEEEGKEGGGCRSQELNPAVEEQGAPVSVEQGAPVSVELEKGAGGVGFTLEGGRGSIRGDKPLVINRIFTGGAAEQSGLQHGDELLQVQGVSLQDMTRFEAWNMIKALPEGAVTAVIRRRLGGAE